MPRSGSNLHWNNSTGSILPDKTVTSSANIEKRVNELIHNSNVELMNDFYHIKYDHNTNDDVQKFAVFSRFLCDVDNMLQCDITHCRGVQGYRARRHRTTALQDADNKESEISAVSIFHILSRIHTYFIHSHDVSQLSNHERKYIENNFKYIQTKFEYIDCGQMTSVLMSNGIGLDGNELQLLSHLFDKIQYHMTQLMDDLCDIFTDPTILSTNTLLSSIISEALHLEDNDLKKLHEIYETILCSGFITKTHLNHHNFVKMLKISAFKVNPQLNLQEIAQIASNEHLTGNVCAKDTAEFMNSLKFGKLFKSIKHWNKKQWTTVYVNIQKWTTPSQTTINIMTTANRKPNSNDIDQKYNEVPIDYIDIGTDAHTVKTFCALTNATNDIAFLFLQETSWNIETAVDMYFRFDIAISMILRMNPMKNIQNLRFTMMVSNFGIGPVAKRINVTLL
eukprot:648394_1